MERKDRQTLKSYFQKGDVPTEEQFAELIDSVPNIAEDGQVTRMAKGWAFYPKEDGSLEISLHTETGGPAAWTVDAMPDKRLAFRNARGETVMELSQDKGVTLHGKLNLEDEESDPEPQGDGYITLPADKEWHDLPVDLAREGFGCRVFALYVAFRNPDMGLNRLTRATAVWQDFASRRIESPQKHWWGWSGGVKIRWKTGDNKLYLQLRSKRASEKGEMHCRIVELFKG